jgi:LysM repeat protein
MNNPSPLVPQGSLLERSRGKSNVRIAIFTILAVHVVLLSGLLMLGCKREAQQAGDIEEPTTASYFPPYTNDLPPLVQHYLDEAPPVVHAEPEPPRQPQVTRTSAPPVLPPEVTPIVPPAAASAQSQFVPPAEMREYTVAPKDTLGGIATKHGVPLKVVMDANPGIDPLRLRIGQKILLPPNGQPSQVASGRKTAEAPSGGDAATYTVKSGDNLTKIATNHGITVAQLKSLNNLSSDRIQVGQKLKVPSAKSMATNNAASRNGVN